MHAHTDKQLWLPCMLQTHAKNGKKAALSACKQMVDWAQEVLDVSISMPDAATFQPGASPEV
jgi:hypothetical protein